MMKVANHISSGEITTHVLFIEFHKFYNFGLSFLNEWPMSLIEWNNSLIFFKMRFWNLSCIVSLTADMMHAQISYVLSFHSVPSLGVLSSTKLTYNITLILSFSFCHCMFRLHVMNSTSTFRNSELSFGGVFPGALSITALHISKITFD